MTVELLERILDDGFKGSGMVFMLVLAYKVYKAKISNEIESNCCEGFSWKFKGENSGGSLDTRINNI
jgi:hypothetical protein